jgi:hypothetical protein
MSLEAELEADEPQATPRQPTSKCIAGGNGVVAARVKIDMSISFEVDER